MTNKKRSGFKVMLGLIGMIKPLLVIMFLAIVMGCAGNLGATFITILGGYGLLNVLGTYSSISLQTIITLIIILAITRGILRYVEQSCNHYIAFKLLARIRHQVFATLRRLAPAKLDGSEKGNLISIITSDIELLEVFYAHTISPIAIAVITSVIMSIFIGNKNPVLGFVAAGFYILVGVIIPTMNSYRGNKKGNEYRDVFGALNTTVLDNLYGLDEIRQYAQTSRRQEDMNFRSKQLEKIACKLKKEETWQRVSTDYVILLSGVVVAMLSAYLVSRGEMNFNQAFIAVIAMMSSFGPVAALSALSNDLRQTLASGNRVLDLLSEEPIVHDIKDGEVDCQGDIICENLHFAYDTKEGRKKVLSGFHATFRENSIVGIHGKSGCGKSTLLKLLMRFYETDKGTIRYGKNCVNVIKTEALRNHIAYVTQDTFLFQDTIENNIKIANPDATREEVICAAKKASIHEFICTLEQGYDTRLGELGDSVSGGEKQRIGLARAFLHNCNLLLLDEPTSNIDSLNEGIILKALKQERDNKTIILVSHRQSTMGIVDEVLEYSK